MFVANCLIALIISQILSMFFTYILFGTSEALTLGAWSFPKNRCHANAVSSGEARQE